MIRYVLTALLALSALPCPGQPYKIPYCDSINVQNGEVCTPRRLPDIGKDLRDPRIDPKPGDVLRKNGRTWRIEERPYCIHGIKPEISRGMCYEFAKEKELVVLEDIPNPPDPELFGKRFNIEAWRKWAKGAQVIDRGQP